MEQILGVINSKRNGIDLQFALDHVTFFNSGAFLVQFELKSKQCVADKHIDHQ
jgi:hypothetical protein